MRIAIDAMGGDQAPVKILQGAVQALELLEPGDELVLVGTEEVIRGAIAQELAAHPQLKIVASTQVITMDDSPVEAIRNKKDSSIVKMVGLMRAGAVDAIISAGNTGALVAAGVLLLKTLPGVERPGIAVVIPTPKGPVMLCDAGANMLPKALHLHQYGVMASLYMQALHGVTNPRVAILNIGSEEEKGTPLVKETRELLQADKSVNFTGYVEGREIFKQACDVVVTDGFTGNVVLKVIEGCTEAMVRAIQHETALESAAMIEQIKPVMGRVWKRYDHEEYGGALLLGVSGLFLKVHGSGGSRAIRNAVAAVKAAGRLDINQKIVDQLACKV